MTENLLYQDEFFIKETLKLAGKGLSWTNPNPLVGAVIVKSGKIVSCGYHRRAGLPHAEIEALNQAKTSVEGTALYVNLEPCAYYGRTPPCVEEIIKAGIKRVVCATSDPNPEVNGKGIALLQKAGIEVAVGTLKNDAERLNEAFFTFHRKKRPFIALKFAASWDGKIATRSGDSKWITNEKARNYARKLRSYYQAVLVGINTIIHDDPRLGVRMINKRDPIRIILDSQLKIPLTSQALRDNNVVIAATNRADKDKLKELHRRNITLILFDNETIPIPDLVENLRKREIISVLVEGGGKTIGSFVDAKLVDKVYAFHAPLIVGGKKAITAVEGEGVRVIAEALKFKMVSFKRFGDNMLTIGYRGISLKFN